MPATPIGFGSPTCNQRVNALSVLPARVYDRRHERPEHRTGAARGPGVAPLGARTCPSARGARSARTTAPTARPGPSFPHDHARSRAYRWSEDGLGGDLRRPTAAVPGVRVLERQRPDPQGADLRAHRPRGQPRRGRQGVLVVPRLHADATRGCAGATPIPQAEFPYSALIDENARRDRRDQPEYELLDTGVFAHALLGHHGRLRQGRPRRHLHARQRPQRRARATRRCTCCRRCGSATAGPGTSSTVKPSITSSTGAAQLQAEDAQLGTIALAGDGEPRAAVLRQRDQHRTAVERRLGRRTRRTGSTTTSSPAPRPSTRRRPAPRRRCATALDGRGRRHRRAAAAARPRAPARSATSTRHDRDGPRAPRPTRSTRSLAPAATDDERW